MCSTQLREDIQNGIKKGLGQVVFESDDFIAVWITDYRASGYWARAGFDEERTSQWCIATESNAWNEVTSYHEGELGYQVVYVLSKNDVEQRWALLPAIKVNNINDEQVGPTALPPIDLIGIFEKLGINISQFCK